VDVIWLQCNKIFKIIIQWKHFLRPTDCLILNQCVVFRPSNSRTTTQFQNLDKTIKCSTLESTKISHRVLFKNQDVTYSRYYCLNKHAIRYGLRKWIFTHTISDFNRNSLIGPTTFTQQEYRYRYCPSIKSYTKNLWIELTEFSLFLH
jgi:hypothetical protein